MRYYIVDNYGNIYGDFNKKDIAEMHLQQIDAEEIEKKEIEIIEGE